MDPTTNNMEYQLLLPSIMECYQRGKAVRFGPSQSEEQTGERKKSTRENEREREGFPSLWLTAENCDRKLSRRG